MPDKILVIGGAGYIGSHMVRTLKAEGYFPVVMDNLTTGHADLVPQGVPLEKADLANGADARRVFEKHEFSAVMHFAAASLVPESVKDPLKYYRNNASAFVNLLGAMMEKKVQRLIFSSTAAVYGEPREIPIREDAVKDPTNPYGRSKLMMEQMMADAAAAYSFNYVILRYFNAAGAHLQGETGERHDPETHLIPNVLKVIKGTKKELTVFGEDYPTRDGTCVRDYIHVEDLCRAHLLALKHLEKGGASDVFNLGSDQGYSIREIISTAEKVTGKKVALSIGPRRPGDPSTLIASSAKAEKILNWKARLGLEDIISSAWRWHQRERE